MENKKKITIVLAIIAILCLFTCLFTSCTSSEKNLSAYEIAVENGYKGTETEWLASLKGETIYTDSAYDLAVKYGYDGTEEEWLASLKGEKGDKGATDISSAVNSAILSVVSINAYFTETTYVREFGGESRAVTNEVGSAGSGVIFKDDKANGVAYIVTNYHVVYNVDADSQISDKIYVYLYGMELSQYKIAATYIGGSMTYDIAVLKIDSDLYEASNAKTCTVGSSGGMSVGDTVIAIGNPEAEGIAVTSGIMSLESEYITMTAADENTVLPFRVMRIDAAVNGGNSGGGLFNDSGELVGIVNAKIVDEKVEGMAYAIPIDLAYSAVTNIINNCDGVNNLTIQRCIMGITVGVTDSQTVIDTETGNVSIVSEVSVISVESGSVAAAAGLQANDIVNSIRYDSKLYSVEREYDITNLSLLFSEGDTVIINVTRGGVAQDVTLTMGASVTVY